VKMTFELAKPPDGVVAYLKMPVKLHAMDAMGEFVAAAYGKGCVCDESPDGWLRVLTPAKEHHDEG